MPRIAFVNMVGYRNSSSGKRVFTEPVHLLAMHGICKGSGHTSNVFQFGHPTPERSIRDIKQFKPDVLGLSFVGHSPESVQGAQALIGSFESQRPRLLVGGTDVNYLTNWYIDQLSPFFPHGNSTFLVAVGAGESLMTAIAPFNFDWLNEEAARRIGSFLLIKGVPVVAEDMSGVSVKMHRLPLDQQSFERPYYDFSAYDWMAQVKWETGCWGSCSFCGNEKTVADYRSPSRAVEEIAYLSRMGVQHFAVASPNFTAHPEKASSIIDKLPIRGRSYVFPSRVDSLYFAIRKYPDVWKKFARGRNEIQLGVESFIPERLGPERLGKYSNLEKAKLQENRLKFILDFFRGTAISIVLYVIPFDWQMNLDELEIELGQYRFYITAYPYTAYITLSNLGQILYYEPGSFFSRSNKPEDFYRFKRDPRCLLLALLIREKTRLLREGQRVISSTIRESNSFLLMTGYALLCLQMIKEIPSDDFVIDPIVEIFRRGGSDKDMLDAFYSQLGILGKALPHEFDSEFAKVFPESVVVPSSTAAEKLRRWMFGA